MVDFMKLRSFFLALAAGCLILLSIGAAGLNWILAQTPLTLLQGEGVANPTATVFIPRQAPAMISLLVNPDRLEAFRQLQARPSQRGRSHRELNEIKASLLANTGLSYSKDIQPWLGDEITLAITSLDYDRNAENGVQPGYLLAVKHRDAQLAREFLQLYYSKSAIAGTSDLVSDDYKGVKLLYRRPLTTSKESNLASGVVGNFVLFANSSQVLRDAINNAQASNLNLKNAPFYEQALDTIPTPRIGVAFAHLAAANAWFGNQTTPKVESAETITLAIQLNEQGLVAQTGLLGTTGKPEQKPVLSQPVEALKYLPASSILSASGTDLDQLYSDLTTKLTAGNFVSGIFKQILANLNSQFQIDLAQEVFPWVNGEYAISLLPDNDWVFVAEKTDPEATETGIANLDKLAQKRGLNIGNFSLGNRQQITAWTELKAAEKQLATEVKGVHTSIGKYEIIANSVDAIAAALSDNSLLANPEFQTNIATLPKNNNGYVYIDWEKSQPIFEKQLPLLQVIELFGQPLFENLHSLTITSSGTENGISRASAFLKLGN